MTATNKNDKSLANLDLKNVKPCVFLNNKFISEDSIYPPLPDKLIKEKLLPAVEITATPGGNAFVATTQAFGLDQLKVEGAALTDGSSNVVIDIAKNNFTLNQLLKNFTVEEQNLFVFDNVKIIVKDRPSDKKSDNALIFSGVLRMDQLPLSVFKNYLGVQGGILFGGEIDIKGQNISDKISVNQLILSSAPVFEINPFGGLSLSNLQLKLVVKPDASGKWTITPELSGQMRISHLGKNEAVFDCKMQYTEKSLKGFATAEKIDGLFGVDSLSLSALEVSFSAGQTKDFSLTAELDSKNQNYKLSGLINQDYVAVSTSISSFDLNELSGVFLAIFPQKLNTSEYDVKFSDVTLSLATADCQINGNKISSGVSIGGSLSIFDYTAKAIAHLSKEGVGFSGNMKDLRIGPATIKDASLNFSVFSQASKKPTEFSIQGDTKIEGLDLKAKVAYEKQNDQWTGLVYAAIDARSFGLGNIISAAKGTFVDSLQFSKVAFIYATSDAKLKDPDYDFQVRKGLQLMGVLEEVPALSDLTGSHQMGLILSAHYGTTLDIQISIANTALQLGSSVKCDPFTLGIKILPSPALDLIFGIAVTVPKQETPLHFTSKIELGMLEASGSGTMTGYWENPFSLQGLKIGPDLALEIGIIYEQFLASGTPSEFAFAGGLQMGEVIARMAVKISENPTEEILYGELDELSPTNLVKFAEGISNLKIPDDAIPDFFELKTLKLYCAPAGGSIGTITYEPGFSFSADLILFDKEIAAYTRISEQGVVIKGHVDKMAIGPLKIHGENGADAELDLELTSSKQAVFIDGEIEFLESSVGAYVNISNNGVAFNFKQTFIGLLTYNITGNSLGSFDNLPSLDFKLSADFDSDLTDYLKNNLTKKIAIATTQVEDDIGLAQKKVTQAQKQYEKELGNAQKTLTDAQKEADKYLRKCQQAVAIERQKFTQGVNTAKTGVKKAKESYNDALTQAQNQLIRAQTSYDTAMRYAHSAVTQAQNSYDSAMRKAQSDVDSAKQAYVGAFADAQNIVIGARNQVNSLASERNKAVKELKHLPWTKAYKAPYLSVKIAGLEVALRTAQGALYAAEGILKALQEGGKYAVFESAKAALEVIRYGGKYGALEAAKKVLDGTRLGVEYGVLEAAKQSISVVKQGSEYTVWQTAIQALNTAQTTGKMALIAVEQTLDTVGTSTTYIALEAAKQGLEIVKQGGSAAAFETAKASLEVAKQGSKVMLGLAKLIAEHSGDLIDIHHVVLSGSLKEIEKGSLFRAEVTMSVLSKDASGTFDMDIREPATFVENLFKQLLSEAKKLIS